jgi:dihydroorotase
MARMAETVIRGRFCTGDRAWTGWLSCRDGRVSGSGTGAPPAADQLYAYPGCLILPGLVDPHVHFREPGLAHKEEFLTGSLAAIAGGVTTVLDMPNTAPAATTAALLAAKGDLARGRFWCDYGFHMLYTGENLAELQQMAPGTYASVKVFMAGHATTPYVVTDNGALQGLFAVMAERRGLVTVHAEDGRRIPAVEPDTPPAYTAGRPPAVADGAVAQVLELVAQTGCRAHIVHVSTAAELALLAGARRRGLPVTWEFIHPHLSFTADEFHRRGAWLKLSPPLRAAADQAALWAAVLAGQVDCLASDHAPHTRAEKERAFAHAPAGMPGVQESLPAVFTGLCERGLQPVDAAQLIARLMAEAPARLFGLSGKGRLDPGADADLLVLDPAATWSPTDAPLFAKCGWSPYAGRTLRGRVQATLLRGQLVYETGRPLGQPGGRCIHERA